MPIKGGERCLVVKLLPKEEVKEEQEVKPKSAKPKMGARKVQF